MRKGRTIALTAGAGAIGIALATVAASGATAASTPAVTHTHSKASGPAITLSPGVRQVTAAQFATPPTTAQCEAALKIACFTPNQIPYDL